MPRSPRPARKTRNLLTHSVFHLDLQFKSHCDPANWTYSSPGSLVDHQPRRGSGAAETGLAGSASAPALTGTIPVVLPGSSASGSGGAEDSGPRTLLQTLASRTLLTGKRSEVNNYALDSPVLPVPGRVTPPYPPPPPPAAMRNPVLPQYIHNIIVHHTHIAKPQHDTKLLKKLSKSIVLPEDPSDPAAFTVTPGLTRPPKPPWCSSKPVHKIVGSFVFLMSMGIILAIVYFNCEFSLVESCTSCLHSDLLLSFSGVSKSFKPMSMG